MCHRDHDVTYSKHGSFFCDCGAKEDGSCIALTPRLPLGEVDSGNSSKRKGSHVYETARQKAASPRKETVDSDQPGDQVPGHCVQLAR